MKTALLTVVDININCYISAKVYFKMALNIRTHVCDGKQLMFGMGS